MIDSPVLFDQVMKHTNTLHDKLKVYYTKIDSFVAPVKRFELQ
jgi:hypothetical protein